MKLKMAKSNSNSNGAPPIKAENYGHSPIHYAVAVRDHSKLSDIISSLPPLPDPSLSLTESHSISQETIADNISALLDRRDVPYGETPLHLAVRLRDLSAARALASAGADVSLQNSAGWNPLQEALCRRASDIALLLLRLQHRNAWSKWRRRLPRVIAVLRRMRDFYMEISFHFESSVIPFVGKIAPSDTYRLWKRDGNLRADTSLAGFEGLKIQRADQSFLFVGDGDPAHDVPSGSLLVLNHEEREILDALENAEAATRESDGGGFCSRTSVFRPGMDVTRAELVGRTNWRGQEKTESVGEWKAKVYEMHNVVFSFRSRKVAGGDSDVPVLELDEDEDEDGFDKRRHSSFVGEEKEWVPVGRKSVDLTSAAALPLRRAAVNESMAETKEKAYVKSLRPALWLTEQFPLKTEELVPLLDILANKVKAVRRLRELLTTKLPPGTFPVKVAIPVVPTVRVVIAFTKFVELQQPVEQFSTPFSSPRHLLGGGRGDEQPSSDPSDPFAIPSGYTWTSGGYKSRRTKTSKSVRKSK